MILTPEDRRVLIGARAARTCAVVIPSYLFALGVAAIFPLISGSTAGIAAPDQAWSWALSTFVLLAIGSPVMAPVFLIPFVLFTILHVALQWRRVWIGRWRTLARTAALACTVFAVCWPLGYLVPEPESHLVLWFSAPWLVAPAFALSASAIEWAVDRSDGSDEAPGAPD